MSYRKIDVNGKTFRYTIGRSHVKIIGEGYSRLFTKAEIGHPVAHRESHVVMPRNIRDAILGIPLRTFVCERHDTETIEVDFDPFAAEIDRKSLVVPNCSKCLDESGWEI
ncbi:hypothetical protein G6L37_06780 [Agrobacterium rubi]|nr:hypothetical protein [Agrobacterium rubi]NTF25069.1 hypothetical protein [Agrobacterium rubi]